MNLILAHLSKKVYFSRYATFGQKREKVHFFQKATFENRYSGYSEYGNSKYDSFSHFVPLFGITTKYENKNKLQKVVDFLKSEPYFSTTSVIDFSKNEPYFSIKKRTLF